MEVINNLIGLMTGTIDPLQHKNSISSVSPFEMRQRVWSISPEQSNRSILRSRAGREDIVQASQGKWIGGKGAR